MNQFPRYTLAVAFTALTAVGYSGPAVRGIAYAQWQVPTNSVPYGKGAGKSGFGAAGPGTSGYGLFGNGAGSAPSFQGFVQPYTGSATRTWQNKNSDIVSALDFTGVDPTGTTDSSTGLNNACATGKTVYIPSGTYLLAAPVNLGISSGVSCSMTGAGMSTVIQRAAAYTAGNLFTYNTGNTRSSLTNLRIVNASGVINNTSGAAIAIGTATDFTIDNIEIQNGANGIVATGNPSAKIWINNFQFFQDSVYAALNDSFSAIQFSGAHHYEVFISNSLIGAPAGAAHVLQRGLYITSSDGIQLNNVGIGGVNFGIAIVGGGGTPIDDIYGSNLVVDNTKQALLISGANAPNPFTNIRFTGFHFNGQNAVGASDVVSIGGDADYIQLVGGNINLGYGSGVVIAAGNNYDGVPKRSIIISSIDISANNLSATPNTPAILLATGASGVTINAVTAQNRASFGAQSYGVVVGDNSDSVIITNSNFLHNVTGGCFVGTGTTNTVIANNLGSGC